MKYDWSQKAYGSSGSAQRSIIRRWLLLFLILICPSMAFAGDWPMWRADSGRTAKSTEVLAEKLHIQWVRQLPALKPAYRNHRLQFDGGYEPIIADGRLFLSSSLNDSVSAYNAKNGQFLWHFYTNGPVRFAPVYSQGRLYFGSDDGHLYCLDASSGKELWRFRAVPSSRTVLGNRRVISVWPIRGGPVLADGTLYFAAGVWPFEGVFVYALDAKTGQVKWLNDRTGHIYGVQPHNARSIGGLTPQGYLVVNGDELIVPCSAASPAIFNRLTGKLIHFKPPSSGRKPGGWFASLDNLDPAKAKAIRRGELTFDSQITGDKHEDNQVRGEGVKGIRSQITLGDRVIDFAKPPIAIKAKVHAMAVAQGMLYLTTVDGRIFALAKKAVKVKYLKQRVVPLIPNKAKQDRADYILSKQKNKHGYGLILGAGDGSLIEALMAKSPMHFLVIESDVKRALELRQRWDEAGLYGTRVVIKTMSPAKFMAPSYFASLILCEDPEAAGFDKQSLAKILESLRPFGGVALLATKLDVKAPAGAEIKTTDKGIMVSRNGALPGTTNYAGDWKLSRDELVRAPLGVLWYDDAIGHFKRSPQPLFINGVMVSQPKDWSDKTKRPYALKPVVYTDIYTGRQINADESLVKGKTYPLHNAKKISTVHRQAKLDNSGQLPGKRPDAGDMINPLTGLKVKRVFPKSYGCDGGVDYGHIISLRSGTAAYYDKRYDSGTIHISGPRSGCTNSIIPANGLLNLPYFYEGCTCSYPLPVALSLVKQAQTHEQWATYGKMDASNIGRLGINFGAPGDRMTDSGTLWLDLPSVGGPSPLVKATIEPSTAKSYYHHSLWIRGGRGWPWVAASGIKGIRSLKIEGLRADTFTVRLIFAETEYALAGKRKFSLTLQGKSILEDFDPVLKSGGMYRAYVHEVKNVIVGKDGLLEFSFEAKSGETILSGIELGTKDLPLGAIEKLVERNTKR